MNRIIARLALGAGLALAAPWSAAAQETANPLSPFSFYIGTWKAPDDRMTVIIEWGMNERVVHWTEISGSSGDPFAQGLIGYDAADDKIIFHDFFGMPRREMMFHGEYRVLGESTLERAFTAHYGDGWNDSPPPGSKIQFRERWEPVGQDGWRWSSEIFQNDEWRQYQPPIVMQRQSDTASP